MQIVATPSIRLVFDRHANPIEEPVSRKREETRRKAFEDLERQDARREKERKDEKEDAEFLDLLQVAALATSEEIAEFTVKLDRYDALTVEALQENERASAEVRERIWAALAGAAQLPDNRHVFKTADGTEVFDERGAAVSSDEIRPEDIPDFKPRFESYWADRSSQDALAEERQDLLAFQDRLDTARETLGKDGLTGKELKALEKDIDAAMPPRLRNPLEAAPEHAGADPETGLAGQQSSAGNDASAAPKTRNDWGY